MNFQLFHHISHPFTYFCSVFRLFFFHTFSFLWRLMFFQLQLETPQLNLFCLLHIRNNPIFTSFSFFFLFFKNLFLILYFYYLFLIVFSFYFFIFFLFIFLFFFFFFVLHYIPSSFFKPFRSLFSLILARWLESK